MVQPGSCQALLPACCHPVLPRYTHRLAGADLLDEICIIIKQRLLLVQVTLQRANHQGRIIALCLQCPSRCEHVQALRPPLSEQLRAYMALMLQPTFDLPLTVREAAVGVALPVATLSSSPSFRLMRLMESLPSSEHSPLAAPARGDGRAELGRPTEPDPGREVPSAAMAYAGNRGGSPLLPAGLPVLRDT